MKKKMLSAVLLVGLLISGTMTAYATDGAGAAQVANPSGKVWHVTYNADGALKDDLGGNVNETLEKMQPGDTVEVSVELKNNNATLTHWYMKNNVTKSMEQQDTTARAASGAVGGAYTYELVYTPQEGERVVLYTSEKVGGENGQGLLEINKEDTDYFYLDSIESGKGGTVTLTVGLDGQTQGNSYQDKVANMVMQFAVEPEPPATPGTTTYRTVRREVVNNEVVYLDEDGVPLARNTDFVRTSDEMNLYPYVLAACISGSVLLIFAIFGFVNRRKEEEGGAA